MTHFQKILRWINYFVSGIYFEKTVVVTEGETPQLFKDLKSFDVIGIDNPGKSKRVPPERKPEDLKSFEVDFGKLIPVSQKSKDFVAMVHSVGGRVFLEEDIVEILSKHKELFKKGCAVYFLFWYESENPKKEGTYAGQVYNNIFCYWKADNHNVLDGYVIF